jgi:TrmH family RNA methyltransferase
MIVVVLHEAQELVNIAHVVRAMKNFAFTELRLVSPREYDPFRIEGIAHRSGDVLERVRCFEALEPALADCVHVVGFSARERTAKRNAARPRDAAAEVLAVTRDGPVALLFGREDRGLSNEALDRCHRVVTIPTSPDYPSLNLGHAVALALYELALARGDEARPFKPPRRRSTPATAGDLERVFADTARALESIGFFRSHASEQVMRTVREIAHRVPLDEREARLLRAMAIETAKDVERRARRGPAGDGA